MESVSCGEVFEGFDFVESAPVESEVAFGEALVVDFVCVMGCHSDCLETGGFVDDGSVQNGVVEGGLC